MKTRLVASATVVLTAISAASCGGTGSAPSSTPNASASSVAATPSPTATASPMPSLEVAGTFPPDEVAGLRAETDIPFTAETECGDRLCSVPLDVLAPVNGDGLPTVVLVPGGPVPFADRRYLTPLAAELAKRDNVVFLTTWRSPETGNGDEEGWHDVGCAVRYARAHTAEYGGDPKHVLLVGKSQGSYMALQIGIEPDAPTEDCLAAGSSIPDGIVGLAGFQLDFGNAADSAPPMWLVSGSEDDNRLYAPGDLRRLQNLGFEASYQELEGITHENIHDPEANPAIVDIIMDAVAATAP